MTWQSLVQVQTDRHGVVSRRGFLRRVTAGALAGGVLGWKEAMTLQAEQLRKRGLACILLFMRGGPSQFETFDPKPGTANGGPTKAIPTAVSGIHIAEPWTHTAQVMKDIALIRSLTNKEGEHQRAAYQLHTGYAPSGGVKYPSFGSIAAMELGPDDFDLPHFVSIGSRVTTVGSGFLGMKYAPFVVGDATRMPGNVELPNGVSVDRFQRRTGLLEELEEDFATAGGKARVEDHKALYDSAARMVLSPRLQAFDLSKEKDSARDRYGRTSFGQGCLLARRLVEAGVTFVEVESNGWDTHQNNFETTTSLSRTVDPAFAALINDLKERGLLETTLVIWMGEFGRTPRINPRNGRDHFPVAFSVALAGAGIKGGRVVGATSENGTQIKERPVTVPDLFCTFCQALKINPRKENLSSIGRPIKIVDGGQAVQELFS
ncbi:MAG: DUF1501 domain-containing protein [Gemmataceae bacterium]|nr:DUF1501 domain-containing protein [Gemmataceae bacterium]MDW8264704.1 DUF1501 domain-containing protein [Gemmataceae bacterium]